MIITLLIFLVSLLKPCKQQCVLYSEDIDVNSFKSFNNYQKNLTYEPISSSSNVCKRNESHMNRCVLSSSNSTTQITLCLSPRDFLKLVKKLDFTNLTLTEQAFINDFLLKLELMVLDSEDKSMFNFLCRKVLKRALSINNNKDYAFFKTCTFVEKWQKGGSLYRKLIKQNVSLVYNETNYVGNYMTEVQRGRMERNLTGKLIDWRALKEALDANYSANINNNSSNEGFFRRTFHNTILQPYLTATGITQNKYRSHYNLLTSLPKISQETRGELFRYAFLQAYSNASLYYKLYNKPVREYKQAWKYFYNRLSLKIGKVNQRYKGSFEKIKLKTSELFQNAFTRFRNRGSLTESLETNPYTHYILINDTDADLNPEEFPCRSVLWWLDLDYYDPDKSPFTGFVNGSKIDTVFYFLIVALPPPRTIFKLVDWWLAWHRRSWTFNKLVPNIALEPKPKECMPGWPYLVDTIRYNGGLTHIKSTILNTNESDYECSVDPACNPSGDYSGGGGAGSISPCNYTCLYDIEYYDACVYPKLEEVPYNFCPLEREVVESGDLSYCSEWDFWDEVFFGWIQLYMTDILAPYICRVRILQVLTGWMVYKENGVLTCTKTEDGDYIIEKPVMMEKCLTVQLIYTVGAFLLAIVIILGGIIFVKFGIPAISSLATKGATKAIGAAAGSVGGPAGTLLGTTVTGKGAKIKVSDVPQDEFDDLFSSYSDDDDELILEVPPADDGGTVVKFTKVGVKPKMDME